MVQMNCLKMFAAETRAPLGMFAFRMICEFYGVHQHKVSFYEIINDTVEHSLKSSRNISMTVKLNY